MFGRAWAFKIDTQQLRMSDSSHTDPAEMIQCPHSAALQDPLASGFIPHFATRLELAENKNVCAKCAANFRRHHQAVQHGREETPAEFHPEHHITFENTNAGFIDQTREIHHVEDFDYNAVEELTSEINTEPIDVRTQMADLLARIIVACWVGAGDKPSSPRIALQRFAILCTGLRPDITQRDFTTIAAELGVTKQATSKQTIRLQSLLNLKFPATRSPEACEAMRQAQLERHA